MTPRQFLCFSVLAGLLTLGSGLSPAAAQESAIDTWAEERDTNFFTLPDEWRKSQPVTLNVMFSLKAVPGSAEANAFLANMTEKISAMTYHTSFKVEPAVVPSKYHYVNTITFDNIETWRAYETSKPLLDFYYESWKPAVDVSEEMLTMTPRD